MTTFEKGYDHFPSLYDPQRSKKTQGPLGVLACCGGACTHEQQTAVSLIAFGSCASNDVAATEQRLR